MRSSNATDRPDPGADYYEAVYRELVVKPLQRRAANVWFRLEAVECAS